MKLAIGILAVFFCLALTDARTRYGNRYRLANYRVQRPRLAARQVLPDPGVPVFADGTPAVEEVVPVAEYPQDNPVVPGPDPPTADEPEDQGTRVIAVPVPRPAPSDDELRRTPAAAGGGAGAAAGGSYFPVTFGGVRDAAVALSNSLSTGQNGKADSRSVAYGNPEAEARRSRLRYRRH